MTIFIVYFVLLFSSQASLLKRQSCGNYNPTFSICCNGVVRAKSGIDPSCCETQEFDAEFSICCNGVVRAKSGIYPSCCGTGVWCRIFNLL